MEPTKLPAGLLGPSQKEEVPRPLLKSATDQTSLKAAQNFTKLIAPVTQKFSSSTTPSAGNVTAAVGSYVKFQTEYNKALGSEGVTSAIKTTNAFAAALKGAASTSYAVAQPLNFVAALTGIPVKGTSPSLIGRASYGLSSLALQLRNIAATLFMMVTGYKIYENAKWSRLSEKEFYEKIQSPTVDQMDSKHNNSEVLKKLVYGYFEEKVEGILKKGLEQGLKAVLNKEGLKTNLDAKLKEFLDDENSGFIKDRKSWDLCQEKRRDPVEAFGLYIELMLARQSHQREIKRVFGKDGLAMIRKNTPDLYNMAMAVCKRRLVLDTFNFVLGVGVMSAVAFTVSASLALPLLGKISKDSQVFEYIQFVLKTFVLGSVVFSPYGLLSLVTFNLGLSVYSLVKGGVSKLPFMSPKELENYTRWDRLLIQFNIILAALSIVSTGFMGLYVDVPALTTVALASTQLPWMGLNMYGLSEIWKREELKREAIRKEIKNIAREEDEIKEHIARICKKESEKSLSDLFEEYSFHSIQKAYLASDEIRQVEGFETDEHIKSILKDQYLAKRESDETGLTSEDFIKRYSHLSKEKRLGTLVNSWLAEYEFDLIRKAFLTSREIKEIEGFGTEDQITEQLDEYKKQNEDIKAFALIKDIVNSVKSLQDAGLVTVDTAICEINRGPGKDMHSVRADIRAQIHRITPQNCEQILKDLVKSYNFGVIEGVLYAERAKIQNFALIQEKFEALKSSQFA